MFRRLWLQISAALSWVFEQNHLNHQLLQFNLVKSIHHICKMFMVCIRCMNVSLLHLYKLYSQRFTDTWSSHPYLGFHQTIATKLEAHNFTGWIYRFFLLYLRASNSFQFDNLPVQKARSMKTWFVKLDVEELRWPAQRPHWKPLGWIGMLTEPSLLAQHQWSISLMLLWLNGQIPTATCQRLVQHLPTNVGS